VPEGSRCFAHSIALIYGSSERDRRDNILIEPSASFSICAVVVCYRPDTALLARGLQALAPQVDHILVVANDGGGRQWPLPANAELIEPGTNLGLGAAYNLAVRWARAQGAGYLLLLDQDSVPAPKMVSALVAALAHPGPVAAAGPLWHDSRTGQDGFFVHFTRCGVRQQRPPSGSVVTVDFLVSSGSLIALDALNDIGPFDPSLFIEHVDTDWAMRARAKGYRLYGVVDAHLDHAFGEATLTVSILGVRLRLFRYAPERNYYMLRNSIILWRKPYAPWPWVLHDVRRTVLLTLIYALLMSPRLERVRCMARAVRDAFRAG
jgi:rhamnosyltransferase